MSRQAPSPDVTGTRRPDRSVLSMGLLISLLLNVLLVIVLIRAGETVASDIEGGSTSSERLDRLETSIESMRIGLFNDTVDRVVEAIADDQERPVREAVVSESSGGASATPKLDRLADQFSGDGRSAIEQLKSLSAWIACSIGAEYEGKPIQSGEDALEIMESECGRRDIVFQEVGNRYGIRHRRVGFLNIPGLLSHAASEFRVDDEWRFLDATYGRFFSLPAKPDIPVSIADVRRHWPNILIGTVVLDRNQSEWLPQRSFDYMLQRPSELSSAEVDDLMQLYLLSDLVLYDPDETYFDRLTVPFDRDEHGGTGVLDKSSADMQRMRLETSAGPIYAPLLPCLGQCGSAGPNVVKVFELLSNVPGTAEIRLHFVGRAPPIAGQVRHAVMRYSTGDRRVEMENNGSTVTIHCRVYPPLTSLVLRRLDRATTQLDAIEWRFTALSKEAHAAPSEP